MMGVRKWGWVLSVLSIVIPPSDLRIVMVVYVVAFQSEGH
jgi:hypothetical protein